MEAVRDALPLADAAKVVQVSVECHYGHRLVSIVTIGTIGVVYQVYTYFLPLGVWVAGRQCKGNQEYKKVCVFHGE